MSTAEQTRVVQSPGDETSRTPLVSVVIPCLNEAENIQACVAAARAALADAALDGEVIVADNASEDGSAELAAEAGAGGVDGGRRGFGRADPAGFAAARGENGRGSCVERR